MRWILMKLMERLVVAMPLAAIVLARGEGRLPARSPATAGGTPAAISAQAHDAGCREPEREPMMADHRGPAWFTPC